MGLHRLMVIHNPSADADARYINTFHFSIEQGADRIVEAGLIENAIDAFWNAVDVYLSNELSAVVPEYRWYDLSETPERIPYLVSTGPAKTTGTTRMHPEACVAMTYKAQYVSGSPSARRRGRIYLGPLAVATVDSGTGRVLSSATTGIGTAASALVAASDAAANWKWVVYSRVDNAGRIVTDGWVDSDVDIQRRRGYPPGGRVAWT